MEESKKHFRNRRDFIKGASSAVLATSIALGVEPVYGANIENRERVCSWFKDTTRLLHLDSHFAGFKNIFIDFDAEAAAQMFEDAGVQMVSYFAKCWGGYSYYPTKIGILHPTLDRDYTGELTAALKKRGIKCIIYFMMATERELHKTHPDWVYNHEPTNWKPENEIKKTVAIMCFNSPYVEQVALPQMKEIVELYDVDGFFIDIVMQQYLQGNCYCKYCRELYAKEIGGQIPLKDTDPKAFEYRKWSNSHMEAFMEKVFYSLAEVKSDIAIINNYAWFSRYPVTPPWYVPHVTWDTPTPAIGNYSWNFSMEARYLSTLPDVPFSCMNTRGNNWGEYSLREEEAFMHECAILLASCGGTYLSDIPYPSGNPDPAVYEVFGKVNQRTKALKTSVKGCRPVKEVAVLHSADSIWSKTPLIPSPTWTFSPAYYSVTGAHKALSELHVQMGILNSEVVVDTLHEYKALILSDQRILNENEIAKIKKFVRDGGALIATNETGTRDIKNNQLKDFALADVLGVRYLGSSGTANCYLRGTSEIHKFGIPKMDIQAGGGYSRVETTTAKKILDLVPPYQGIKSGTPPPAEAPEGPGVTVNRYGKGKALYCAAELFGAYFDKDTPVMRKLASWMLSLVYPEDSRMIVLEKTPINVELFYNYRGNERFIHLVNYSGDKRDTGTPQAQDFTTVHGIKIRIKSIKSPNSIILVPDGRKVAFEYSGGVVKFDAFPLKIHQVYAIDIA